MASAERVTRDITPIGATAQRVSVPLVTSGGGMLPLTLAGLGIREGAWLLLLRDSGLPPERIVAFSLFYFVSNLLVGSVGGAHNVWKVVGDAPSRPAAPSLRSLTS